MRFKKSIYISRPVLNPEDIEKWARTAGFKSMSRLSELHVTVVYAKEDQDWLRIPFDAPSIVEIEGGERALEQFGDATVLTISSDVLQKRWKTLMESGVPSSFPAYRPHVTITYEGKEMDLGSIKPYGGIIKLGPEEVTEASTDWEDDHEELIL